MRPRPRSSSFIDDLVVAGIAVGGVFGWVLACDRDAGISTSSFYFFFVCISELIWFICSEMCFEIIHNVLGESWFPGLVYDVSTKLSDVLYVEKRSMYPLIDFFFTLYIFFFFSIL